VELKRLNIDVTSIMRNNRKEIPEVLKKVKVKKGEIRVFQREEDKLVAARYHDKKDLTIITTFDSFHKVKSNDENNKIKKSKYEVIDHYNHYSKGVDRLNQYCQYYRPEHKEVRWWRTLFTQVLEIILYNGFVHAKILKLASEYKQFRLMFIKYLCNFEDRSQIQKPVNLAGTHFPSKVLVIIQNIANYVICTSERSCVVIVRCNLARR